MRYAVVVLLIASVAHAQAPGPAEPKGPHPRLLLDNELRAAWKADAKANRGPVKGAIALCSDARDTAEHDNAVYQGSEWAKVLQACLVAWAATEDASFSKTAIRFFNALLDDLDKIGDKAGGDKAATRDSGYAIRNLGPYTAIAYDWLHAQLPPDVRAKARKRWAAWLAWYREKGYRARTPGTNYQAGYLVSATLIAIAQGGEAGEEGMLQWRFVADELWGKDMAAAFAEGGILDGGDWPEGWQYGPLAVTSYALAARVAKRAGIPVQGVEPWLESMLKRHVYGLTPPGDKVFVGGDTETEAANMDPQVNTLNALSLGDSSADTRRWAKGELSRLRMADADFLLHDALATVGEKPALVPRATWPTWYRTTATATLFARTRWDERAVWFVAECAASLDIDHRHPKTGNFVLSRGKDDVIVDPSPYGSASTLTSNAPTVMSAHLPTDYIPSQGSWGEKSKWLWMTQTKSGVVAARCDYADQYKFQDRPSDVPEALRDFVLLPNADGVDAALLVIDRANTTKDKRTMQLRFRVPGELAVKDDAASAMIGSTRLGISTVAKSGGTGATRGSSNGRDCFNAKEKGKCDAARFLVSDYRLTVPGPKPRAVHAITAGDTAVKTTQVGDKTWTGVEVSGVRDAIVAWPNQPATAFAYAAKRGAAVTHVVIDTPEKVALEAKSEGDHCTVSVKAGGELAAPVIVTLDDACNVAIDPEAASASSALGTKPPPVRKQATSPRSGCCGAQTTPASPITLTLFVAFFVLRRKRSLRPRLPRRSR